VSSVLMEWSSACDTDCEPSVMARARSTVRLASVSVMLCVRCSSVCSMRPSAGRG
jgi:hypothetical protein